MKKIFIIIVIVLLAIGGLTFYYYLDKDNKEPNSITKTTKSIVKKNSEYKDVKNSIFKKYYDKAYKDMEMMSIEEKIGQLFFVRYDNNMLNDFSNYYPGGYVLFAKDFNGKTKDILKSELSDIPTKVPLAFAVDEEGGNVTRVSKYSNFREEKFFSPRYYYEQGGYDLLKTVEKEKAELLLNLGLNVNLAPVADVSTNPDDFIYNRSFGYNAEETAIFIKNMVSYANEAGITSCLKHFPGYGNNSDTHTGSAYDDRNYDVFTNSDYLPFEAGIKEKVPMILVSHNIVTSIDEDNPASLSEKIHNELREILKFSGIIITDDLDMSAIRDNYKDGAVRAVQAKNDIIITSDFINDYNQVLNAYNNKLIDDDLINKAVVRIIAWKYSYNIIK